MQVPLRAQQGYGSRDASFSVMLAAPCVPGDPVLCFIANGYPRTTAHFQVSMAMASEDVWHANLQENGNGFKRNSRLHRNRRYGFQGSPISTPFTSINDEVTINREIQRFCTLGRPDAAINFLIHLEERAHFVSETSYRHIFRACSSYGDVKRLQTHLRRHHLELSLPLGELLVVALIKCGSIQDALQVFHALPQRTVLSWSVVLSHHADCAYGLEALRLYSCMQDEGVEPNEYTYVALFKACGSIPDLQRGIALHAEARIRGFVSSPFVANTLVSMYGKCRRIVDAENVFFGMPERNLVSWNAMLSAYVENGEADNALHLYEEMENQEVNPNTRTFLFVLQACCLLADKEDAIPVKNKLVKPSALVIVHLVHKDVHIRGLESEIYVGNSLMKAYGKCGSIGESQGVFRALAERNVVTWNTLLSVFVEHGRGEKAIRLYRQMQEEGVALDERTFVNAVQACCIYSDKEEAFDVGGKPQKLMCLDIGQGLHADARKMGFASNVFLGNTLVALYGKCGSLLEAENVLASLSRRDIVSWTAMLYGYVDQGKVKEALLLYKGMCEEGMCPDERTIAIALQACCMLLERECAATLKGMPLKWLCFQLGQALYLEGKSLGISSDPFIISHLINLYGKCGKVAEAELIFCKSFQKGVVTWNMMLSTYNEQGKAEKALELFRQMHYEGMNPDERTFVIALQSCCALVEIEATVATDDTSVLAAFLEIGQSLHADIRKKGLGGDPYISSALVSLYGKCGSIKEAENIFSAFSQPNVNLWNAMLSAYLEQDEAVKVLQLSAQMVKEQVDMDKGTCVIVLQAVCGLAEKEKASRYYGRFIKALSYRIGQKLHAVARQRGFDSDIFVSTNILSVYGKCRTISEAEAVFAELPCRSIVCWNSMLAAYIDQGLGEQALSFYEKMQEENTLPDEITLSCLLQVSCVLNKIDFCRHIHFTIVSADCDGSLPLANTLIHAYGHFSLSADAQAIFNKISAPDATTWNAVIAGYARERNTNACLEAFDKMQQAKVRPTGLTFLSVLSVCGHAGLVNKALTYFECMHRDYGITPELEHYVAITELLCSEGDFQRLKEILLNLPELSDLTFWYGIFGVCQKYRNMEIEELVLARAGHLQSSNPKAYKSLLSMRSGDSRVHSFFTDEITDEVEERDPY